MTFENLPQGWEQRPITDPALFDDVVDLVVSVQDRWNGALYLLLCDGDGRLLQPCAISDVPEHCEDPRAIEPFVSALSEHGLDVGLVVVVARRGIPSPQDSDVSWMRAAEAACTSANVRLLGTAVATPLGVFRLDTPVPQPCG